MSNNRAIVVTAKEMEQIKSGNFKAFMYGMIRIGNSIQGKKVYSMRGPFLNKEDGTSLFVIDF